MYIEIKVGGKKLQVMVEIGVDNVCMEKQLTDQISLPYKKVKGYMKGVSEDSFPIHGVARGTDIQVGP